MRSLLAFVLSLFFSIQVFADQAARYLKPGPALGLLSPAEVRLEPYSEKAITVTFLAPQEGELFLRLASDPGIVVAENTAQYRLALENKAPELTFTVQSLEPGRYHLMFHADVQHQGQTSGRVFGLALQVGPPAAQTKVQAADKSAAPKLILMQGEESVR